MTQFQAEKGREHSAWNEFPQVAKYTNTQRGRIAPEHTKSLIAAIPGSMPCFAPRSVRIRKNLPFPDVQEMGGSSSECVTAFSMPFARAFYATAGSSTK